MGKKKEYLHYTLVDSMKNWRAKWFYAGNMYPPLEVHNKAASVPNARWEKETECNGAGRDPSILKTNHSHEGLGPEWS